MKTTKVSASRFRKMSVLRCSTDNTRGCLWKVESLQVSAVRDLLLYAWLSMAPRSTQLISVTRVSSATNLRKKQRICFNQATAAVVFPRTNPSTETTNGTTIWCNSSKARPHSTWFRRLWASSTTWHIDCFRKTSWTESLKVGYLSEPRQRMETRKMIWNSSSRYSKK